MVSNNYINLMKSEYNSLNHKYKIKNITRDLDLTSLLLNDSISINRFLRTAQGNISPNSLNLSLKATAYNQSDLFIKDLHRAYREFRNMTWKQLLNLEHLDEYLCKIGDIVEVVDIFNNEELIIFKGLVDKVKSTDKFNGRTIDIELNDNTIKGYEYKFSEDISFTNVYLYNKNDKDNSLIYILCNKYLKIKNEDLEIEDIKINGEYIKYPVIKFNKNTSVMQELAEIIRSIYGNIYSLPNGKIRINSYFDKSYIKKLDLTLGNKKDNLPILGFIEKEEKQPKNNKVEVKFTSYKIGDITTVFSLGGHNATVDDANIKIPKYTINSKSWYEINLENVIDVDYNPKVIAYVMNNNSRQYIKYTQYQLEKISSTNLKVRFNNSLDKDVFIEKFSFNARPIQKNEKSTVSYSEDKTLTDINTSLKSINYKYIQNKEHATAIAKHTFYNECRLYNTVKLRTTNCPFLQLEDVIKLDYKKFKGSYKIIAINQTNLYTELTLKLYSEYQEIDNFIYSEKSNNILNNNDTSSIKKIAEETKKEVNSIEKTLKKATEDINLNKSIINGLQYNDIELEKKINTASSNTINNVNSIVADLRRTIESLKSEIESNINQHLNKNWVEISEYDFNNLKFNSSDTEVKVKTYLRESSDNSSFTYVTRFDISDLKNTSRDTNLFLGSIENKKGYVRYIYAQKGYYNFEIHGKLHGYDRIKFFKR